MKDARTGAVKFRYERDALGNKTAVYLADGSMIRYDYDADGLRLTKTVGSGSSAVQHKYT